jgi:hypothetical protein
MPGTDVRLMKYEIIYASQIVSSTHSVISADVRVVSSLIRRSTSYCVDSSMEHHPLHAQRQFVCHLFTQPTALQALQCYSVTRFYGIIYRLRPLPLNTWNRHLYFPRVTSKSCLLILGSFSCILFYLTIIYQLWVRVCRLWGRTTLLFSGYRSTVFDR